MKTVIGIAATVMILAAVVGCGSSGETKEKAAVEGKGDPQWQQEFGLADRILVTSGSNPYFVLEPGYRLVCADKAQKLVITVLDETEEVMGCTTRVVEEREWKDGQLVEVSRNFFALDEKTRDVFYFGEDVDNYVDGKIADHEGSWRAGVEENKPGLFMPGAPQPGMKFYLEFAPGQAMDRAEIISLDLTLETPAGVFDNCLKTQEGSDLDPTEKEFKIYAPGVGLLQDEELLLESYGYRAAD